LQALEPQLKWAEVKAYLPIFAPEYDNIRAALNWSLACDIVLNLRFIGILGWFWWYCSYFDEAQYWLNAALPKRADAPNEVQALVQHVASGTAWFLGDFVRSVKSGEESVRLWQQSGDMAGLGMAQTGLAAAYLTLDDAVRAKTMAEQGVENMRKTG